MATRQDIDDFLAQKRIALVGVSRNPKEFSSSVYRALKGRGYQLYPVNPRAEMVESERCYPSVAQLPGPVDGALVMLPPAAAEQSLRQCVEAGIPRVWLRWGPGGGAVSAETIRQARERGIRVVDNACPMMFAEPVGFGHACHRFVLRLTGSLPR